MNITAYTPDIPKKYREKISKGKIVKQYALLAISEKIKPVALPTAGLLRISIAFSDKEIRLIDLGRKQLKKAGLNYNDGKLIGAFAYAKLQTLQKKKRKKTKKSFRKQDRKEQREYYENIKKPFAARKIILAEGGTGLGKSRILVKLALDKVKIGEKPVCIAAPTIAVMRHLIDEWNEETIGKSKIHPAIILGRNQFINPENAYEILNDPEIEIDEIQKENVFKWLTKGCPTLQETKSSTLDELYPGIAYLHSDFVHLAPDLAKITGLTLERIADSENTNPADEVYKGLFETAKNAKIVICSHAMLAADMFLRNMNQEKGLLPVFKALLIDEAHIFEMAVASMSSKDLSIIAIRSALKNSQLGSKINRAKAIKLCTRILMLSQEIPPSKNIFITPSDWDNNQKNIDTQIKNIFFRISELKTTLVKLYRKGAYIDASPKNHTDQQIKDGLTVLNRLTRHRESIQINISPVKSFPTFTIGPATVKHLFQALWERTTSGAVLASATLTLPDKFGAPDPNHMKRVLNIDQNRLHVTTPIVPKWITKPVKLHRPCDTELADFIPPKITSQELKDKSTEEEQQSFNKWAKTIGTRIEKIANQAVGGTLVLLTSYALISHFKDLFENTNLAKRIIYQDGNTPFASSIIEFHEKSAAGQHPIWFSLGNAWTGVNYSGQSMGIPADQDNILSDLIIPKVPFGLNTTMTGRARNNRIKTANGGYTPLPSSNKNDAAFLLKQGIGRLVRRENVPEKHLWILDGRIWKGNQTFYGVFQRILKPYKIIE